MTEGNGIVPVMDMNRGYGDGMMGCGGGWWAWILIIFVLIGGWGGGFGGNRGNLGAEIFANGSMTRDQVSNEFAYNDIKNGIRGVQNGLCDGFYAMNTTALTGFNGVQRDVMENTYQLGNQISESRFAAQQCCCETNRNIDAVRAENYKNTCEIVNAVKQQGEETRALIVANQVQDLRDKLADRDRDLQTANFQLSQQAQNATLIRSLRPYPIPAYPATSPYQSAVNANGCGCAFQQQGLG